MNHTVIGIFDSKQEAKNAVEHLISQGFASSSIDACSSSASGNLTSTGETHHMDHGRYSSFFGSLFDKDDEVKNYSNVAGKGCTVTVHASSEQEAHMAAEVMDSFGAVDVDERAQQFQNTAFDHSAGAATADSTNAIPVIEEELQVGKRVVQTGGVRLRSRIIARPVEEHLRLHEEHVFVERNPVNRAVSTADLDNFREETIEVTEKAEVPITNKEMRVVEELHLSKEVEEHDEVIHDTVRHTEVDVENFDANSRMDTSNMRTNVQAGSTDADSAFLDNSHQSWANVLTRMKDIEDDYKVASDDPDVRGWDVIGENGNKIGEVDELIVDTNAMKVRYLEVDVDDDIMDIDNEYHILVPIGSATLDHAGKNVLISTLSKTFLERYPAYRGETISRDYEHRLVSAFNPGFQAGTTENERFYEGDHFDSGKFYGSYNR